MKRILGQVDAEIQYILTDAIDCLTVATALQYSFTHILTW
jgi:hypothetical protein